MGPRKLVLFAVFCAPVLPAAKKPVTLETLMQGGRGGAGGGAAVWAPDGRRFAYFSGRKVMLYDVPAKSEKELISLEPLEAAAAKPPAAEVFECRTAG